LAARVGSTEHEWSPSGAAQRSFVQHHHFLLYRRQGAAPLGLEKHLRLTHPSRLTASPLRLQGGLTYVAPPALGLSMRCLPYTPRKSFPEMTERNTEAETGSPKSNEDPPSRSRGRTLLWLPPCSSVSSVVKALLHSATVSTSSSAALRSGFISGIPEMRNRLTRRPRLFSISLRVRS
jgi:hypothetical protein